MGAGVLREHERDLPGPPRRRRECASSGLAVKGSVVYGSFDGKRELHGEPSGASELDFGQTLLVTGRVANEPVQVNVSVPFVETYRTAQGTTDGGGGVGDMAFSLRWDVLQDARDPVVPGIAALLSISVPSGTAADNAQQPLGADATGLGAAQLGAGFALEKTFKRALFALTGTATFHGSRTVSGVHSQLGPDLAATAGASYTFSSGFSLGAALTYSGSFDSSVADATVPELRARADADDDRGRATAPRRRARARCAGLRPAHLERRAEPDRKRGLVADADLRARHQARALRHAWNALISDACRAMVARA